HVIIAAQFLKRMGYSAAPERYLFDNMESINGRSEKHESRPYWLDHWCAQYAHRRVLGSIDVCGSRSIGFGNPRYQLAHYSAFLGLSSLPMLVSGVLLVVLETAHWKGYYVRSLLPDKLWLLLDRAAVREPELRDPQARTDLQGKREHHAWRRKGRAYRRYR